MGCSPSIGPGAPEVGCAGQSLSLCGPATIPAEFVMSECVIDSTHMIPSKHMKGSLNYGGGGCGKGSGCGKQASCKDSEEEEKSCGGKGSGCGKSKKTSCCANKFKVIFKDINGNAIPVKLSSGETVTIQEVEKQSTAESPWDNQDDLDSESSLSKYNLRSQYKLFDKWSNYDWGSVEKDIEVSAVYRNQITDKLEYATNTLITNKCSQSDADKIQDFSDEYLNYKCGMKTKARALDGYQPRVHNYGKYNAAVDNCITYVQTVSKTIKDVFTTLAPVALDECLDWSTFNDLKKCLLNIESSFVYQTRMSINLDLQDVQAKLMIYVERLLEKARNSEEIDNDIKDYREELDLDLDFFNMDTKDRYKEFVDAFNSYVDTINKCFPKSYIDKIVIE